VLSTRAVAIDVRSVVIATVMATLLGFVDPNKARAIL
jgi:hypothetical protein